MKCLVEACLLWHIGNTPGGDRFKGVAGKDYFAKLRLRQLPRQESDLAHLHSFSAKLQCAAGAVCHGTGQGERRLQFCVEIEERSSLVGEASKGMEEGGAGGRGGDRGSKRGRGR